MNDTPHARAQRLFSQSLIEGLAPAEQSWLDAHLRECAACTREAAQTSELLSAMRSVPVVVPTGLAARTQLKVRLRAQQKEAASASDALLWIMTGASWLLGVFSAPLVWRGFAWIGERTNLPKPVLELGFVMWWAVPALVALAVVLHQRAASSRG